MKTHKEFRLLPEPQKISLDKSTRATDLKSLKYILHSHGCENETRYLEAKLKKDFSVSLERKTLSAQGNFIFLSNSPDDDGTPVFPRRNEAFSIKTSDRAISLSGFDRAGLFYAVQTLLQIYPQKRQQ